MVSYKRLNGLWGIGLLWIGLVAYTPACMTDGGTGNRNNGGEGGSGEGGGEGGEGGEGASSNEGGFGGEGGSSNEGGSSEEGGSSGQGGMNAQGGGSGQGGMSAQGGSSGQGGMNAQGGASGQGGSSGQGGMNAQGGTGGTTPLAACMQNPRCDSFESYAVGSKPGGPWSNFQESGGTLSVTNERAFSGTKSVKFTLTNSGNKQVRMRHSGHGLLPRDEIFMRAMVYIDQRPTGIAPFHWNVMQVVGNSGNIVTGGGTNGYTFQHGIVGGRDCYTNGGDYVPIGRWVCWEFRVNGRTNDVQTFFGTRLDEFTEVKGGDPLPGNSGCLDSVGTGWDIPNAQQLLFGWTAHHTLTNNVTLFMDDVVVSDQRIRCP